MRVIVVGAGAVGSTAVESLHEHHECTVVDVDPARLKAVSDALDVRVVRGDGAGREALQAAEVNRADLVLACMPRDEANLVTAMLVRRLSQARTVIRTGDTAYLDTWRAGDLDVDFIVSSAFETASAIARLIGVPGARQADFFLDGEVQVLQFDVSRRMPPTFCGRPLARAGLPRQSRVVGIVRDGDQIRPGAGERLLAGDRVIVAASRSGALEWSKLLVPGDEVVSDATLFVGPRLSATVAEVLLERGIRVRVVESDRQRAHELAEVLAGARVFNASPFDRAFLRRERIADTTAAVFALDDDARNLYAAVLAKANGARFTIAVLVDPDAAEVFRAADVDSAIDPAAETAEVMVRFAHDPRTRQIAMLDDDHFEVLDIAVRPASRLLGRPLAELPATTSVIGAIVRDGAVLFPRGDQQLQAGDRVIVLAERRRVRDVE
ncbi:MAG: Trk system potassium transporter TrkA, partial [Streptosporangiaceae bacterium]